jgi:hypothetical protein
MMENISWTDHVRNEEISLRVKEQKNILHEIRKRKASWIGHILHRNCLLQQVIEGKRQWGIEVTEWRGSRRRNLLDDHKERRSYSHLKGEALDRTMWRFRFGRGFQPVVRESTKWMREWMNEWINNPPLQLDFRKVFPFLKWFIYKQFSLEHRQHINRLQTKRRPLYLKTQSVPRCKHFSSRL